MPTVRHSPPEEPVLDGNEIQGNSVPGFLKPSMGVAALSIQDTTNVKHWLADLAPTLTTLAQTMETRVKVRAYRGFGPERAQTLGKVPDDVDDAWMNLGVSYRGLSRLLGAGSFAADLQAFSDPAFQSGLAARSSLLGDPTDPSAEGNPANWVFGGPGNEADLVLVFAADREQRLDDLLKSTLTDAQANGASVLYQEVGRKLDDIGKEHFGFQDGISQPGVRGRLSEEPDSYITPRLIDPADVPDAWLYGLPGQYVVWPGEFVFGYPRAGADPLVPGAVHLPGPWWSRNGSYLVFRRLRQDVAGFWAFVTQTGQGLAKQPGFADISAEWLASRIVGRWPSGAPVSRVPEEDVYDLGINRIANNNFGYAAPGRPMPLAGGRESNTWPEAAADPVGIVCPMAAHIRKVNARETPNDLGGRRASFNRRILRRALPFGCRLPNDGPDPVDGNRGLLFVCYQASIADQFEFLCNDWLGSPTNPRSPGGFDMMIGQNGQPGALRERTSALFGKDLAQATISTTHGFTTAPDFVIPTGGGYFFSPSISALRDIITR